MGFLKLAACSDSMSMLGKIINSNRDKFCIITKGGVLNKNNDTNFKPNYIKNKIFESLKNLNTDYIDGYQLHNLSSKNNISSTFKLLIKLKKRV